jgi:hypothetical protein
MNHLALMEPLSGTVYFAVAAINNGVESAVGPASSTIAVGAVSGGFSVSGTVDLSGIPNPGPLYVVIQGNQSIYLTRIASPSGMQAFTITGAQSGTYQLGAVIDMDKNGELGPTDPNTFERLTRQVILTVSGADLTGVALQMPSTDGLATASSYNQQGQYFGIDERAGSNLKMVVGARALPTPFTLGDLGIQNFQNQGGNFQIDRFFQFQKLPPNASTYGLQVSYSDGTTCNLYGTMSEVVSVATLLAPIGTSSGITPLFVWAAPNPLPSEAYSYNLYLEDASTRAQIWSYNGMPSSVTSVRYNVDGRASQPFLMPGVTYTWNLSVQDVDGNTSQANATFRVP